MTLDCNLSVTALLVIASTLWSALAVMLMLSLAPKVHTVISPAVTPWETRSPSNHPSPARAAHVRVLPLQGGTKQEGRITRALPFADESRRLWREA